MRHQPKYSIGLGKSFFFFFRIIFIATFLIVFLSLAAIGYGSYTSGEFDKKIAQPLKAFYKIILVRSEENPKFSEYKNSPLPTIKELSPTPTPTPAPTTVKTYYYTKPKVIYVTPTPNTFDSNKWFEEQKAANDKWAEQKRQENSQWYQDSVNKMNADYKAKVDQMNAETEQWKKDHGITN